MNRRVQQAAETKRQIVVTALDLLSSKGASGLTSGGLSKALGMSKGTLFHHFGDMNEIFLAVLDLLSDGLKQEVELKKAGSLEEFTQDVVEVGLQSIKEFIHVYAALMYFFGNASHNEQYRLKLKAMMGEKLTDWKVLFKAYLEDDYADEDIDRAMRIIDMHFGGLCIYQLVYDEFDLLKKDTEVFMAMMTLHLQSMPKK